MYNKMTGKKENITMVISEPIKKRGRPKKYATAEEAKKMKIIKTVEAQKRRNQKQGGMITPEGTPTHSPVATPRPVLPNFDLLVNIVQNEPTPARLDQFSQIVAPDINGYLSALEIHYSGLPASAPSRRRYESYMPTYRSRVIVGAGRKANIKDIRNLRERRETIAFVRRQIKALKRERQALFDKGKFGGDPEVEDINAEINRLATNGDFNRFLREGDDYESEVDSQKVPYRTHKQNEDDESIVKGSKLEDDSDDSDWSGEGFNPLPDFKKQVLSAEGGMINPLSDPVFAKEYARIKNEELSMQGGHWTSQMKPHLNNELRNYNNIIHHLGHHLKEKGKKDPKDVAGFKHFSLEAEKIKKLLARI
jgi:hypothetical protein